MPTSQLVLIAVLGATLLLAVVLLATLRVGRRRARRDAGRAVGRPVKDPRIGVVVNAAKLTDEDDRRHRVEAAVKARGFSPPLWFHTTAEDPGPGQAREALAAGCDLVLVLGGDGTVRSVAQELAGTGVPLGLLPAGTGNLLARNLRIPPANLEQALDLALGPATRTVDAVRAEVDVSGEDHEPVQQTFLVMAGLGFDAEVMASVPSELKEKVGWLAYVVAGTKVLRGRRTRVLLTLDDAEPVALSVRSVIVGNCGELTGGVLLMPEAVVDDGWLDVVAVAPRGMVGWAAVTGRVLAQRTTGRSTGVSGPARPVVEHFRCRSVEIRAARPLQVQFDGDALGTARVLRATVDPGALVVKAP